MEILRLLDNKCAAANIPFLVVGGHAMNARGVSRQTGDLDLAVREIDEPWWRKVLASFGYKVRYQRPGFVLYSPPEIGRWPVDLLVLDDRTFLGLHEAADRVSFRGSEVAIPSVQHLIAMKLHALRENWKDRELKDLDDIQQLMGIYGIEVDSEDFIRLCDKYGNEKIYERLKELLAN